MAIQKKVDKPLKDIVQIMPIGIDNGNIDDFIELNYKDLYGLMDARTKTDIDFLIETIKRNYRNTKEQ